MRMGGGWNWVRTVCSGGASLSAVLNRCVLLPECQLISKMNLMEISCVDGRWMELAQDCVQWWALVLAMLNFCVLLPQS